MSGTLLIIGEKWRNIYTTRFLLEKNGFKIIGAENGPQGIERPSLAPAGHRSHLYGQL